ncbi:MAG: hypothetical protein AB7U38_04360 [Hyphomicrobiales bacterium]
MADRVNTGSGAGLGVVVGVLIAAVVVIGFFVLGGELPGDGGKDVNVKIETPAGGATVKTD